MGCWFGCCRRIHPILLLEHHVVDGNFDAVREIVSRHKANRNFAKASTEALQQAARQGRVDMVYYLAKNGADVYADNHFALETAAMGSHAKTVHSLLWHCYSKKVMKIWESAYPPLSKLFRECALCEFKAVYKVWNALVPEETEQSILSLDSPLPVVVLQAIVLRDVEFMYQKCKKMKTI